MDSHYHLPLTITMQLQVVVYTHMYQVCVTTHRYRFDLLGGPKKNDNNNYTVEPLNKGHAGDNMFGPLQRGCLFFFFFFFFYFLNV